MDCSEQVVGSLRSVRPRYVRPRFRRVHGIGFVLAEIKAGWRVGCRQCASCHGCR